MNKLNSEKGTLRDPLINQQHLQHDVVVYVRHSSACQIEHDQQRDGIDVARAYGWRQESIILIEDDLGHGGSSVEHRPGYQRMIELISSGKVKAVIAADVSRLSRTIPDLTDFLSLLSRERAVLVLDRQAVDPQTAGEIFSKERN